MSARTPGAASRPTPVPASSGPLALRGLRWLLLALVFAPALAAEAGDQVPPKEEDRRPQKADAEAELARRRVAAQEAARRAAEQAAAARVQLQLAQQARQVWPDEQFERWVFQQDQTADRARKRYEALLTSQVEELEQTCELTLTHDMGTSEQARMMEEASRKGWVNMLALLERQVELLLRETKANPPLDVESAIMAKVRALVAENRMLEAIDLCERSRDLRLRIGDGERRHN